MKVVLGQKVCIEGVRMTCTTLKSAFGGNWYQFFYFNAGEPKYVEFHEDELDALCAAREDGPYK